MLKNTFCHINGVSLNTEKLFWNNSIISWEDFILNYDMIDFISNSKKKKILNEINFSKLMLNEKNLNYFKSKLPNNLHYRLKNLGKIAYIDIETTGLSRYNDEITMIGIYDGLEPKTYINGIDLDKAYERLKEFDIIVSFNGKSFDLPFIEYKSGIKYDFIHLDLRYLLAEFNLRGGLKNIEKELGINRNKEVEDINGFEAVKLWFEYKNGNKLALKKLLLYNREDIVNLKYLLDYYYEIKFKELEMLKNI